jgi:hypothetical protein
MECLLLCTVFTRAANVRVAVSGVSRRADKDETELAQGGIIREVGIIIRELTKCLFHIRALLSTYNRSLMSIAPTHTYLTHTHAW